MNQVAIGPNGEYKIQIDGKWHSVDSLAEDPTSGARKGKVGELWYDIPQADVDPLQARVDAAATAAVPEQAAPPPPEDAGFLSRITAQMANQPLGTRGDVSAMAATQTPEMAELDQAKIDMEYNIRKGDYTQAESDALKEATHTAGDFAGDIGTGAARAFAYEEDYAAILAARNPGSEIVRDGEGNLIIEYPDGRAPERINAKGPTATDALQIPGEIAAYTGIGALARRAAPKLASPAIREVTKKTIAQNAAREAAKAGGFSAAKDVAGSYAATGELDLDVGRTLMEGATAGVLQPGIDVGVGQISKAGQKGAQKSKATLDVVDSGDELATGVREGMEKAGYNMNEQFSPEQISRMNNYYMKNPHLPPEELGRGAYAVSQGEDVVPTNALISQDPSIQRMESDVKKAGDKYQPTTKTGPEVPDNYGGYIDEPRAARTEKLIDETGRPEDLSAVQDELATRRAEQMDPMDKSFKETRAEGMDMELTQSKKQDRIIDDLNTNVLDEIRKNKGLTEANLPPIPKTVVMPNGTIRRVSFGDLLSYRDTISGLPIDSVKKASAIDALMNSIDEGLEDAIWATDMPGIFDINRGGRDFVDQWRSTIEQYKRTKSTWNSEKFVSRALETLDDGTFKHDGSQIADNLFGAINGKFLGRSEARRAVQDLQAQLPDDVWKQVQSELQFRLTGLHKYDEAIGTITGARNNAKQFNEFVDKNPELALTIFGDAESLAARQNYVKQLDLEYNDPRLGAANTSNTASSIADKLAEGSKGLSERMGLARLLGETGKLYTNPAGKAQRTTRDAILNNALRARSYQGYAPQVGGLLGGLAYPEDPDFTMPGKTTY